MASDSSAPRLPTLRRAAGLLFALGILSRLVGLLRELVVAGEFGAGADIDAVYLGMSVSMALTVAIGGSLVRSTVAASAGLDDGRFAGLARAGVPRLLRATFPLAVALAAGAPLWAPLLAPNADDSFRRLLVLSAALSPVSLLSVGVAGLYTGLVHGRGGHGSASLVPLVYNALVCVAVLALSPFVGAMSLVVGTLVAEASQIAVLLPFVLRLSRGARPRAFGADYAAVAAGFWPAVACTVLFASNVVVDRAFAAGLEAGSVAALSYADRLVGLPVGLVASALAIPLFTRLSRHRTLGQGAAYRETLHLGVRLLLVAGTPAAVLLWWTAEPVIGVLLQRGAFDQRAVELSAAAFRGYAAGIPFLSFSVLLASASLTVANPWRVAWAMGWTTALNALLDWLLAPRFGVAGIAFSTSVVAFVRALAILHIAGPWMLRSRGLWASMLRLAAWGAALWAAGGCAALVLDPSGATTLGDRILSSMLVAVAMAVATIVVWKPVLADERSELLTLRRRVAAFMQAE